MDDGTIPIPDSTATLDGYANMLYQESKDRYSNVTAKIRRPTSFIKFRAASPIATNVSNVIGTNLYVDDSDAYFARLCENQYKTM